MAASLCGCAKPESYEDLVQEQLTNDVVGYSRTISIDLDYAPTNARDLATANATVEFVNAWGGIERTNLPYEIFRFDFTNPADGTVSQETGARLNPEIMAARAAQAYHDQIDAIVTSPKTP